jgi:subtilisin family serine protease
MQRRKQRLTSGWVAALLVALLLAQISSFSPVQAQTPPNSLNGAYFAPGQLIIKLADGFNAPGLENGQVPLELENLFARLGVAEVKALGGNTKVYLLQISESVTKSLEVIKAVPSIEWAEPNYLKEATQLPAPVQPNDPEFNKQWHLQLIQAPYAWTITKGSKDIVVGVVDGGIDENHPDLKGKIVDGYNYYFDKKARDRRNDHGTWVASFIGANTDNGQGISGLNWEVSMLDYQAYASIGPAGIFSWNIAQGVIEATNKGARIINGSYGGSIPGFLDQVVTAYASANGVVQVYSSGNAGTSSPRYPSSYPFSGVIAVGATNYRDEVVGFSTFGPQVSVVAPGAGVWTTKQGGGYEPIDGTSFSAPIVSGVAALILSVNPRLTPAQVKSIIEGTSDDISGEGFTVKTGWGRVNAYKAVLAAQNGDTTPNKKSSITGRVSGVDPARVTISLDPFGTRIPVRADGTFSVSTLGKATYKLRAAVKGVGTVGVREVKLSGQNGDNASINFAFQNIAVQGGAEVYLDQALNFETLGVADKNAAIAKGRLFFPETGHSLGGAFRDYWEKKGGLPVFGFPISEEFSEVSPTDGKLYRVQYFERNRFEYHPEQNAVLLGLLGSEMTKGMDFAPASPDNQGRYFRETQHNLSGQFRAYWDKYGGLAIFGFPISEPYYDNGKLIQWFERNRFELHPDNPPQHQVLLGLLGVNLARKMGYIIPSPPE